MVGLETFGLRWLLSLVAPFLFLLAHAVAQKGTLRFAVALRFFVLFKLPSRWRVLGALLPRRTLHGIGCRSRFALLLLRVMFHLKLHFARLRLLFTLLIGDGQMVIKGILLKGHHASRQVLFRFLLLSGTRLLARVLRKILQLSYGQCRLLVWSFLSRSNLVLQRGRFRCPPLPWLSLPLFHWGRLLLSRLTFMCRDNVARRCVRPRVYRKLYRLWGRLLAVHLWLQEFCQGNGLIIIVLRDRRRKLRGYRYWLRIRIVLLWGRLRDQVSRRNSLGIVLLTLLRVHRLPGLPRFVMVLLGPHLRRRRVTRRFVRRLLVIRQLLVALLLNGGVGRQGYRLLLLLLGVYG